MFHFVHTNAREQQREFIADRRLNKNLPTDLKKKLKKSIEEKIAIEQAATEDLTLSSETVENIRFYFFKTIVELIREYDKCWGTDADSDTTFSVQNFLMKRPESYEKFYMSFFQYKKDSLEHFGFLEFLNLKDRDQADDTGARKKEVFDMLAQKLRKDQTRFGDKDNEKEQETVQNVTENQGVKINGLAVTQKSPEEIKESYFSAQEK